MAVHSASGPVEDEEQQQKVVETFCSWQLQGHSLPRIGRRKMYDGACLSKRLDVYWWDAVEASKEYSRTVQPSGRRARRRAHHPREPEAMIAMMTRTLFTFLESRTSSASAW